MTEQYFVLGLGLSGRAAARKLLAEGHRVVAWDDALERAEPQAELKDLCANGLVLDRGGGEAALECIVSPGISPKHPILQALTCPIVAEVELALRGLANPCVAVTGTNGKTTVAMLAAHLLNGAGIPARAVGNIGVPLSTLDVADSEVLVVELSSYQLDNMSSRSLDVGVLLNITADHLDRYQTMDAYAASKLSLGDFVREDGAFWVEAETAEAYAGSLRNSAAQTFSLGRDGSLHLGTVEYILPLSYRTRSKHDLLNIAAALALCQPFCPGNPEILAALATFEKPEHRIEFVTSIDGVSYYNDSKGTNVAAVLHAVDSMEGQVVLIAGGVDKGGSYKPWCQRFAEKVRGICVFGEAANRIAEDLGSVSEIYRCQNLDEAVLVAQGCAENGDSVLLSPGCSSFDMFRNYAHRGSEFKRFVGDLEGVRKG